MSIADYIPVAFFAAAGVILMRDLYNKMSKGAFALFAAGCIDITCAGALKATYKLLYALGICDFDALDALFFPLQSIGFLLAGIGVVAMLCHKQGGEAALVVAPPIFGGTFLFVGLMVAGLGMLDAVLCIIAVKMRRAWLVALFAVSFVCSLGMGYLSSRNFDGAMMNWIAEGVNSVGQGALFAGAFVMHKSGATAFRLHKKAERKNA